MSSSASNEQGFNPYQAPSSEVAGRTIGQESVPAGQPTPKMIAHLKATGPWVLFLAVLGFIQAAFTGLSGLVSLVMAPIVGQTSGESMPGGIALFALLSLFYIGIAVAVGIVSYRLVVFNQMISRAVRTGEGGEVEEAIEAQRRFWKTAGVTTIVMVAGSFLFVFVIVIFSVAATSGGSGAF